MKIQTQYKLMQRMQRGHSKAMQVTQPGGQLWNQAMQVTSPDDQILNQFGTNGNADSNEIQIRF